MSLPPIEGSAVSLNLFKIAIDVLAFGVFVLSISIFASGRELPKRRGVFFSLDLAAHKTDIRRMAITLATIIFVVVCFSVSTPELRPHSLISNIHRYILAIPSGILFGVVALWLTGSRYPKIHRYFAWFTLLWLDVTAILGVIVAHQMHQA